MGRNEITPKQLSDMLKLVRNIPRTRHIKFILFSSLIISHARAFEYFLEHFHKTFYINFITFVTIILRVEQNIQFEQYSLYASVTVLNI